MLQNKPNKTPIRAVLSLSIAFTLFLAVACEEEPKISENPALPEIKEERQTPLADQDEVSKQVFEIVKDPPTPNGGMEAFYKYIGENLSYPETAKAKGIEGRVFVQFIVERDGSLSEVQTVKGLEAELDKAAEEALRTTKWNPGFQRGQAVRTRMIMPIHFKLD